MSTLEITAPDISCEHCKHTIERDLAAAPGVRGVRVDPVAKTVHVDYDQEQTGPAALRTALSEIGYPPD